MLLHRDAAQPGTGGGAEENAAVGSACGERSAHESSSFCTRQAKPRGLVSRDRAGSGALRRMTPQEGRRGHDFRCRPVANRGSEHHLRAARRPDSGRQARQFAHPARQGDCAGRRVRLRQIGHQPGGHGHPAADGERHRADPVLRSRAILGDHRHPEAAARRPGDPGAARQPHRQDLPGADDLAVAAAHDRQPDRRSRCRSTPTSTRPSSRERTEEMLGLVGFPEPERAPTTCIRSSCRAACASAP